MEISVIIPVYNSEKYLKKCMESLMNQSFDDFEVLIINDGSTDNSQKIIDEYVTLRPDVFKTYYKENGGQSSARNYVIKYAKGNYITFLDSDDYIAEDYLKVLHSAAVTNNSDMVCSGQLKVDETGKTIYTIKYKLDSDGRCVTRRLNFAGKMYKTEFLMKHFSGFAEGKTYEDNPFNLKMFFLANRLTILEYVGYFQVIHVGSTTASKIIEERLPLKEIEEAIRYINKHKDIINDYEVYEYTVLSFLTYFTFEANKHHHYMKMSSEVRKSDLKVVLKVCDFSRRMVIKYFPKYYKNSNIGIFRPKELEAKQRLGAWLFVLLCRMNMMKIFCKIYYRL